MHYSSNHRDLEAAWNREVIPRADELMPTLTTGLRFRSWVAKYTSAMASREWEKVAELRYAGFESEPIGGGKVLLRRADLLGMVNFKLPLLESLERSGFFSDQLVCRGCTAASIGSNLGVVEAYLAARYDVGMRAYDIPFSYACRSIHASPLLVNFFDGHSVPPRDSHSPEATPGGMAGGDKSQYDGVLFLSVLHHAANHTPHLLQSAARRARRAIFVYEDLETGNPMVTKRNLKHEPNGIFRTDTKWRSLFQAVCPNFVLLESDESPVKEMPIQLDVKGPPVIADKTLVPKPGVVTIFPGVAKIKTDRQRWYLLVRTTYCWSSGLCQKSNSKGPKKTEKGKAEQEKGTKDEVRGTKGQPKPPLPSWANMFG